MDVSLVGAYKSFIRERVSSVVASHLGGLGGFGVAVLEVEELHALHARIGKVVGQRDESTLLILENLKVMTGTRGGAVHWLW
jgi:hypothetical protein